MASSKHLRGLWWIIFISIHIINSNGKTEEHGYQYTISQGKAQNIYKGSVYEFVQEPLSWNQAHTSCELQDGNLLRTLNDEIQKYLQSLNTGNGPWWISQNLMYKYSTSGVLLTKISITNNQNQVTCSYMVKDPFQVVSTPNCSAKYGSLCVQDSVSHLKSSKVKSRPQRDLLGTLSTLTGEQSTTQLIQNAKDTLKDLETTTEELTFDNKMTYLQSIYNNIKLTTPNDTIELSEIVNCTAAMLLYTQECQLDNMDELEQLISLAGLIYQRAMNNNGTILMNLPTGTIYVTRQKSSALGGMRLGSVDGGYCQLPSLSAMTGQLPAGDINVQVFQFKDNPLQDLSNESITGATLSFTLQTDNSSVKLSNLPGNIEIYLPWADAPVPEVVNIAWKQGYAVTSGFNITDTDMTVILSAIPNQNITLNFMLVSPLEPNSSCWNQSVSVTYKNGYRWLIHPEMIKGIKGSWSVMISPINYTSSQTLSFQVSVFVTKCLYWDTDLGDWSRNGCMVGPNTWPNLTQCLCNHTTFFGSSFFVMPNQVDLSQTAALFATVKENYIVVVLLSCFFAVYLMVVMWAWYSDRKALRTRKMTLLEDNHPCARYNYLINVQTGHRRRAGTTAKVKVTLNFSEGQSEPYNLSDPEKPVFERGGVDVFLLSLPFFLGELQGIEILHDNSGGSPDWYLGKVMVQDLQTQEVTHFLCSTWLRGANCSRTFNSAKKNEVASFGNIFQTRTSSGFRDEHIWVSIVDPPRRSPFTRVQRVSCCMSLLLCTMAINIMFWNIPTDAESPVILEIGSLKLTWQEFMVAIESGLFMFPINILIITIFRHIKPRILPNKDKSGGSNNAKQASTVSMNTIVKETIKLLIHLSKHPKNMLPPNEIKPEASGDLFWALNKVNDVIEVMQVESVGDGHWVYCSHFVLFSLSHISLLLEHVGEKGCFLNEELRQARGTVRVLLKKAEMTSSRYNLESPQDFQVQKKKQGWWLPWWFVFIGWFLLFTMSGISTFFTLLYGFQYGKASSIQWVITLMLSLVQSIFILQPLKVILVAIFFAMILRPVAVEENEEVELLLQGEKELVPKTHHSSQAYQSLLVTLQSKSKNVRNTVEDRYPEDTCCWKNLN